jgi:centromere protein I
MVLVRVYKNFCPDIIIGSTGLGRSSTQSVDISAYYRGYMHVVLILKKQPDAEWRKRLLSIQDFAASRDLRISNRGGFRIARNGSKRSKISILPEVHTFHASEVTPYKFRVI